MTSDLPIKIRRARLAEAPMLTSLMRRAFKDAFAHNTRADDLKTHMDSHFALKLQMAELRSPDTDTLLAFFDAHPAGYAQILPRPAPDCVKAEHPVQMQRFYLLKSFWGTQAADELMKACLATLSQSSYSAVWLSCWNRNERALSFYRRWGFSRCGTVPFIVGSDRQTDFILLRPLGPDGNQVADQATEQRKSQK
jgi:ribosomal protein S18 acetylase RimI-like enzyme